MDSNSWFLLMLVCLVAEIVTGTYFLLALSVVSAAVGVLVMFLDLSAVMQAIVFAALSLFLVAYYWFYAKNSNNNASNLQLNNKYNSLIGEIFTLIEDTDENNNGRIKIGDVFWNVICNEKLIQGTKVKIVGQKGSVLTVDKQQEKQGEKTANENN